MFVKVHATCPMLYGMYVTLQKWSKSVVLNGIFIGFKVDVGLAVVVVVVAVGVTFEYGVVGACVVGGGEVGGSF